MNIMTYTCKHCGDKFIATKEEQELFEDGYTERPDTCQECADLRNNNEPDDLYCYSDADSGL